MGQIEQQLIYGAMVEGFFIRGLSGLHTPALIEALRAKGLDLERPLAKTYPRAVVLECVGVAAAVLFPSMSTADAWFALGKRVVPGLMQQPLMSATVLAMRLAGPRLTMKIVARTFRQTNNYTRIRLSETVRNHFTLELWPTNGQPTFMQAVIEDMLLAAGAKTVQVGVVMHDPGNDLVHFGIAFEE